MRWSNTGNDLYLGRPWLSTTLPVVQRRGVEPEHLLKGTRVFSNDFERSHFRVQVDDFMKIILRAQSLVDDPHLWQVIAESSIHQPSSSIASLLQNAPNFGSALRHLYRFSALIQPLQFARFHSDKNQLNIAVMAAYGRSGSQQHALDIAATRYSIGIIVSLAQLYGVDTHTWQLTLANTDCTPPLWHGWFATIEQAPITMLRIPLGQLKTTNPSAEPAHYVQALRCCMMQRTSNTAVSAMATVFRWIDRQLNAGAEVSSAALAAYLQMSSSSCKRLFAANGQTFQNYYDYVRLYQLLLLLEQRSYSNTELAGRLGYSNPSNFRRACKRWLGVCPETLRQRLAMA